jgi:DNA-binding PadR family transcriptional regulator
MTTHDEPRPLHALELGILLVLMESDAHAYRIVTELERRQPEQRIYAANLYRRLSDMVGLGLLEEAPVPAEADPRRRRYYRVTPLGRRVARAEALRLQRLVEGARQVGLLEPS